MGTEFEKFYKKYGKLYEQYMHGDCHIFAIALSQELGYPIQFAMDKYDINIEGEALIHAYCVKEDYVVHIGGKTKLNNVLDEFDYNIPYFKNVTIEDIENLIREGFLHGYNKNQLDDIRTHIRSNIELYN